MPVKVNPELRQDNMPLHGFSMPLHDPRQDDLLEARLSARIKLYTQYYNSGFPLTYRSCR